MGHLKGRIDELSKIRLLLNIRMDHKTCRKCHRSKPICEFHRRSSLFDGVTSACGECRNRDRLYHRHRTYVTPEQRRERQRAYARRRRAALILQYGGKCQCCGETCHNFLCFDHVRNNGAAERRVLKGYGVYQKLLKAGRILEDYQLLCHNCNASKAFYGICPHQEARHRNTGMNSETNPTATQSREGSNPAHHDSPEIPAPPAPPDMKP